MLPLVSKLLVARLMGGTICLFRGFSPAVPNCLMYEEGGLLHSCRLRFFPGGYNTSTEGLRRFRNLAGVFRDMEDGIWSVSWIGGKERKEE